MPNALTWLFLAALLAATVTRLWLAQRQVRHVRAHREAVPPSFADSIPLHAHQKAADYTAAKTRLGMIEVLIGAAALVVFTLGGLVQWLSDAWGRWLEPGSILHGSALLLGILLLQALIGLPTTVYRTFGIESRFGFNRMTVRLFIADLARHAAVALVLGAPLLVAVLWLMGKMGEYWWLYVWLLWTAYSLVLMMVYPALIMPLFNKFTPITEGELAGRVARLLERTGFRSSGLYLMDGSKRSSHGNAVFTGFGAAKRIVLFDTLVSRLQPPEVEAVLAHELGHYRLRHVALRLCVSLAAGFAAFALVAWLGREPWFQPALGVADGGPHTLLLVFAVIAPAFGFWLRPLSALVSRRHEYAADRFAARHADAAALADALVKLYRDNASTLTPDRLYTGFHASHPPALARIARLAPGRHA